MTTILRTLAEGLDLDRNYTFEYCKSFLNLWALLISDDCCQFHPSMISYLQFCRHPVGEGEEVCLLALMVEGWHPELQKEFYQLHCLLSSQWPSPANDASNVTAMESR